MSTKNVTLKDENGNRLNPRTDMSLVDMQSSEDIEKSGSQLNLADRAYVETTSSVQGNMGYKILRKSGTFASQVTAANTIYEIRYDYDLSSSSVTIPKNCVLKFNGGSLKNGTLVGQNTIIDAEPVKIFGDSMVFTYSNAGHDYTGWKIKEIYPEWFGAKGDGTTDDTASIQKAFDAAYSTACFKVYFINSTYIVSHPILVNYTSFESNCEHGGNYHGIIKASSNFASTTIDGVEYNSMFLIQNPQGLKIEGIYFEGGGICNVIQFIGFASGDICRCRFYNYVIGVVVHGAENMRFQSNSFDLGGIGVRIDGRVLDINSNFYVRQSGSSSVRACNMIYFYGNTIIRNNIGVFASNSSNVDFFHNETSANTIFAVRAYDCKNLSIMDGYSEGDGVCTKDVPVEGADLGTSPAATTSASLIQKNLDGVTFGSGTVHYHGIYYAEACYNVVITGNIISYKKRGVNADFLSFDTTQTSGGIDAILIGIENSNVTIEDNAFYNWNKQHVSVPSISYDDLVTYAMIKGDYKENGTASNTIGSVRIDKSYFNSIYFTNNATNGVDKPLSISCGQAKGNNLNSYLRIDSNNYSNTYNSNVAIYDESKGLYFHELPVKYIKTVEGIPFYLHTDTTMLIFNLTKGDIVDKRAIEICRYYLIIDSTVRGFPYIRAQYFSTSGSVMGTYTNIGTTNILTKYNGIGMQRFILSGLDNEQLKNILVAGYAYPASSLPAAQNFYVSPFFVREVGNESVPDFSKYRFDRNMGTTAQRPTSALLKVGFRYYDTTLNKPIWVKSVTTANDVTTIVWVDATGATV